MLHVNSSICLLADLDTYDISDEPLLDLVTRFTLAAIMKHSNLTWSAIAGNISQ
ncbi:hypothetical protein DPMN_110890 [Dreissena polymorpha]|uniref:Uncharacterized protein n=1 Tax=Dreissena polymorpha TaxID=45954 RepID=A0A9D4KDM8_DREPO|nr:hypothetical protein DPMN_110890 [Dreissena polymorpha]